MSEVEFQTETPQKRNSWKAAPTWLNVLWLLEIAAYPCGILTFFVPQRVPHTQIGRDLATPEVRAAILIGYVIGFAVAVWMWFRLRSESGPAAKGAPWGAVAFVLFGWAYGAHAFLSCSLNMFVYPAPWRIWIAGAILLSGLAMTGAYFLERRRRLGIFLTAAYWIGGTVEAILRSFYFGDIPAWTKVAAISFSATTTAILLYCLFRPAVREWAAY